MDGQQPHYELPPQTSASPVHEEPRPLGLALLAGLVAAVVGGVIWAYVVKLSDYEVGIVAWGIGFLVGMTVAGVSRARGSVLQAVAVACALAGILLGKYLSYALIAQEDLDSVGRRHRPLLGRHVVVLPRGPRLRLRLVRPALGRPRGLHGLARAAAGGGRAGAGTRAPRGVGLGRTGGGRDPRRLGRVDRLRTGGAPAACVSSRGGADRLGRGFPRSGRPSTSCRLRARPSSASGSTVSSRVRSRGASTARRSTSTAWSSTRHASGKESARRSFGARSPPIQARETLSSRRGSRTSPRSRSTAAKDSRRAASSSRFRGCACCASRSACARRHQLRGSRSSAQELMQ